MSKLEELIRELCPNGVQYCELKEIADISTGSHNTNEGVESGMYPFYVRSQEPLTLNSYDYDETAIITAGDGVGVGKVFHFVNGKYALHQRAYRIHANTTKVEDKFLYYYFCTNFMKYIEKTMFKGSVPSIRRPMLNAFKIPVPPLEVQQEIIHLLDDFTAKTAELQSELNKEFEARKKQYEHYEETLLNGNGAIKIRLGDICHIKARIGWQGLTRKEYLHKGDYYLITGTDFSNGQVDFKNCHYVNKERYDQDANIQIQNNDVLVTKDGTLGKVAFVTGLDKPATLNAGVFVVRPTVDNINPRYLYYILASKHLMEFAKGRVTGGTIKHLNQSIIVDFPVPLLDFENQSEIVNMLDTVNALYNTLQSKISSEIESRQKQYEFYRDKLLTFKELK